jgi:para-aminobenzoate synthetase component 1
VTLAVELAPPPGLEPLAASACFADLPRLLLLDSSARGPRGRYSFLTADPVAAVPATGDPLTAARALLAPHRAPPLPGLPPFQGGIAGYLSYDWGAGLEGVARSAPHESILPDAGLGLYDWVIAWDHAAGRAWIVAWTPARLAWVRSRLAAAVVPSNRPTVQPSAVASNFTRAEFEAAVSRIREYIAAGDVYQVNLAQQFRGPCADPPFDVYRRLRARNPAPFGAYLDLGSAAIVSISPERFLQLDAETGLVTARPIKGTRPRGATPRADAALARELVASDKDRAENVMIVDLLRNDLGKACRTGSVAVPELFALESHPTVHHLVSAVTGTLRGDADAFDLVRAAFPGGSVTGAPKIRAMQIIAELERAPRGVYCGAIGYVSATGAMDLNIPIRTMTLRNGEARFHAGAGIVWDSDPAAEYDETLAKARALIEAVTSPRRTSRTRGRARRPA